MDKQQVKYKVSEIVTIVIIWLFAAALVYLVYLKLKMLHI
jgi:hypothetical protein